MPRMMFVNLPVHDLGTSAAFFAALGFTFAPQFTDENATAMVVSDLGIVMLLTTPFFSTFTTKEVASAAVTEVTVGLSAESREDVDALVDRALSLGATACGEAQDHGFMYGRSFYDLDGHLWDLLWMDPATAAA